MPDLSANLEPFLLVARSTKGAAAAKVIVDATSAPGVYGFGELLDMPNIKQLQDHETLSSHYGLLQLFAYGTFQSYKANQDSYPPLNPAQIEKLKQLSLVSLGMESRSLTYASLLPVLEQPSIRALEDLVIDAIYAGIISGRMDQVNETFSVDWVLGRDLDVGGSELRDLGMRLENWCEMTQNLLSSLDTTIARSRARTIESNAFAGKQQQDRFDAYDAYSAALKTKATGKGKKQQQGVPGAGASGPSWSEQGPGSSVPPFEQSQLIDTAALPPLRDTRFRGKKASLPLAAGQGASTAEAGAGVELQSGNGGPSRVRTLSGMSATPETEAVKRTKIGNK